MPAPQHSNRPEVYGRTGEDFAERRNAVRERASELKRALMHSTMRMTAGRAYAAYNEAARRAQRSGSPVLRFCVALVTGALTMLIPFPRLYSLQGQLAAADAAALPRVMVYAHPTQCAKLSLDATASVVVETAGREEARYEAQINELSPHAGSADAPVCHVALQLLANPAGPLPADAVLSVVFSTQPRNWVEVVMDEAESDSRLREASTTVRSYTQFAWQHSAELVAYVAQHSDPRHYWGMLNELVGQGAQDAEDSAPSD